MKRKIFFIAFTVICCAYISNFHAHHTYNCDFPSFYRVAKTVLDPSMPITAIYELDDPTNRYNIPDWFMVYRYSVPAAYLMTPLGLMPYFISKAVFIFINIILSLVSLAIALRLAGAKGSWFFYPLALSVLFIPFLQNIRFAQTNGILLFLITVAIVMATKKRFYLCGGLIGFAALFKLFPIALAMALGLKNWRIFAGCAIPVGLTALTPGFREWIESFTLLPFDPIWYSVPYRYLEGKWFLAYLLLAGAASAFFIYHNRHLKYEQLAAFAIPAFLLAMPFIEHYHLLLLFFSFGYMLPEIQAKGSMASWTAILSVVCITIGSLSLPREIYLITGQFIFVGLLLVLVSITAILIQESRIQSPKSSTVHAAGNQDISVPTEY